MRILALGAMAMTLTGCALFGQKEDAPGRSWFAPVRTPGIGVPGAGAPEVLKDSGATLYAENCVVCHGRTGKGDGPLGRQLPVPPADLTTLTARHGGTFPAQDVMASIYGYPGKFHRGTMPEFGPELIGPVVEWQAPDGEIIMTPKGLLDIVAYVERLQG